MDINNIVLDTQKHKPLDPMVTKKKDLFAAAQVDQVQVEDITEIKQWLILWKCGLQKETVVHSDKF